MTTATESLDYAYKKIEDGKNARERIRYGGGGQCALQAEMSASSDIGMAEYWISEAHNEWTLARTEQSQLHETIERDYQRTLRACDI